MVKPPKASSSKGPAQATIPAPAIESTSSTAIASSSTSESTSVIPVPPSPWRNFQPSSPSPLSPSHHKIRSPRTHVAGAGRRKAPKTPLSRLVLEKAVLHRDKAAASSSAPGVGGGGGAGAGNVFGAESTRRTNVLVAEKGKGRDKVGNDLKVSTKLGQSTGPGLGLAQMKKDLSLSQGVGPRGLAAAGKAGKAWR